MAPLSLKDKKVHICYSFHEKSKTISKAIGIAFKDCEPPADTIALKGPDLVSLIWPSI